MAAPSCPRCSGRCELMARDVGGGDRWRCRDCDHTFVDDGGRF